MKCGGFLSNFFPFPLSIFPYKGKNGNWKLFGFLGNFLEINWKNFGNGKNMIFASWQPNSICAIDRAPTRSYLDGPISDQQGLGQVSRLPAMWQASKGGPLGRPSSLPSGVPRHSV